ncbi:outer membrane receptor protein involved in Fe transport [Pedobacter cryoconitis]|uniref:Outer membrane receptor protein involved in Fe transport n=2 Tax=Pedobacter cryoconitis TaxID=188932 RepID=A0A327SUZ6_9SPHI|nr:outer membrane receptor protein involved in Fe transport [Pedobacter cryoconitis]
MKLRIIALLVTLLLTALNFAIAQTNLVLTGQVYSKIPLDGATVYLYQAAGSIPVQTAVTDSKGTYALAHLKAGTYRIAVMMIGYAVYKGDSFQLQVSTILPVIQLQQTGLALQEVKISGQKALIEKKIDRTVINVEAMVSSAGSTVYEVLEKSPGIMIDQSGGVSLKGKGAVIFIDDKPAYLSGADLESYLKSLPSSTVDQIELMSNPPAKYDAAGNGGIINIRTKKSKLKGFNGGVNLSYVQGEYTRTNNSFNFNYRYNKVNLFGNAGLAVINNYSDLDINRHFENANGAITSNFLQNSFSRTTGQSYTSKVGMDYYLSEKTTLGIGLTGLYRPSKQKMFVKSVFTNAQNLPDSTVLADNRELHKFRNIGVNLNYRHLFDKNGRELTADIDYVNYKTQNNQSFDNNSYPQDGLLASNYLLTGSLPAGINIYSAKMDYSHPLKSGVKLETGLKTSYTQTDNIADYFYTVNQVTKPDYNKTNHFLYKEHINAAYVNANKEFKGLTVQAGLRLENTVSNGNQLGNVQKADSTFKRNYTGLFPTLFLQYKLDSAGTNLLSMDYGRRIDRPYYQDLNPFLSPIDKFTYYTGNPFLKPSYTNSIELSHTYKGKFTTSLSYGKSLDQVNETIEIVNGIYYSRPGNIGSATVKSLSFDGSFDLASWFNFHFYGQVTNIHTVSAFYTGQLDTKGTFYYLKPILQFKAGKDWTIQLDGYYQSKITNVQFVTGEQKRVNVAIAKKLSANTTIKLVVNDVFHSYVNSGAINNLALTKADYHNVNDSRTGVVSLSYRFGKAISNLRKHEGSGAESEQKRVKN